MFAHKTAIVSDGIRRRDRSGFPDCQTGDQWLNYVDAGDGAVEFDRIFLTREEAEIMEALFANEVLHLSMDECASLLRLNLIRPASRQNFANDYIISGHGRRYMEYVHKKREEAARQENREEDHLRQTLRVQWVSIIVSNVIALAALIIAIFSLTK